MPNLSIAVSEAVGVTEFNRAVRMRGAIAPGYGGTTCVGSYLEPCLTSLEKAPTELLEIELDWGPWLTNGEIIQSASATADAGLSVAQVRWTSTTQRVKFLGGTVNLDYDLHCQITTAERVEVKTIRVMVRNC